MDGLEEFIPDASGPFVLAMAHAMDERPDVPLRAIMNPDTSPVAFLPFLAAHRGVQLWFEDWPVARKRQIIREWPHLASLIGTREAAEKFLAYVDATIVQKVTHPTKFVAGRSPVGLTPIGHKAFAAHFLVKVDLVKPANCFIVGRSSVTKQALRTLDREPLRRINRALVVSKAPDTSFSVTAGHRRRITFDDTIPLDGSFRWGDFTDRKRL